MWWVLTVLMVSGGYTSPQLTIKEYYGEPRCRQQEEIIKKLVKQMPDAGGGRVYATTDCYKKLTD